MKVIVAKGDGEEAEFVLHDGVNTLGRGLSNRIRLLDPRVSRRHCNIRKVGLSLFLLDLGTKNGTLVNGTAVTEQELKVADEVKVGGTTLRVVDDDYAPKRAPGRVVSRCLLRDILNSVLGKAEKPIDGSVEGFQKFARKGRRLIWRPRVETDPPEGKYETVIPHTDPD